MEIKDINNKEKVAIVVVGYNRKKSLKRLLGSLLLAEYPSNDIPLVISIDCSGDEELYCYVRGFEWPFGTKYVNIQAERLGLLRHIYQCGDLTKYFKAIILLEDDLYVSRHFYSYVLKTLDFYSEDSRIAEISLYKNERNGYVGLPFVNEQNGSDVFLMQDVSTWGQCWTELMWREFTQWRDSHQEDYYNRVDMPDLIKSWTRAWSKYYNAYVVDTGKYCLYPNVSLTTNFSDAGEHGGDNNSLVQVNLQQSDFEYRLYDYESLVKYDIYFNNVDLPLWLNIPNEDVCLDVYGFHENVGKRKYILSTRHLPYKVLCGWALNLRPIELNVKNDVRGEGIYLYDTSIAASKNKKVEELAVVPYFLEGFDQEKITRFLVNRFKWRVINKIKRFFK